MNFLNATRMEAACTLGLDSSGRESLVVVVKGTFDMPQRDESPRLSDVQRPLVMADTFTGTPGSSAPVDEAEFCPVKRLCDVLLVGSAHAPGGRPAERVRVDLRVGPVSKSFDVVGGREWRGSWAGLRIGNPRPYVSMPFAYDVAFGGVDRSSPDAEEHAVYDANPVGRGFLRKWRGSTLDGCPLPCTECSNDPVLRPDGRYVPVAYGPVGRAWAGRRELAGTFDEAWRREQFPFLPRDFDELHFQAAPPDQRLRVAEGRPLRVELTNLTPDGRREFELPCFEAPVHVFPKRGIREDLRARLDTIVLRPDEGCLTMVWRVSRPLTSRSLFEIGQVVVGRKGRAWWQRREEVEFPIPIVAAPMHASPSGGPA